MLKGRRSTRTLTVKLDGQRLHIQPLNPQQGLELCLLVGPYVPKLRRVLRILTKDISEEEAAKRLHEIAQTMSAAPGDFLEFVGLLLGRQAVWVAEHTTAAEIVGILPALAKFHGLWEILVLASSLGLFDRGE